MTVDYALWWRIQQLTEQDRAAVERRLRQWRFKRGIDRLGHNLSKLGGVAAAGAVAVCGFQRAVAAAHEAQLAEMRKQLIGRQD